MTTMTTATASKEPQPAGNVSSGRKVVDEVSGWLRVLDDGTVDRTWTGPPEALTLMQPVAPYVVPRDGHTLHDLPGEPNLRVYLPEARGEGRLPVIVHLHGGGFCVSHPSWLMYHHFYARLACAVPAAVVSVELPLAPERRLPAHIDTGVAALRRLRDIVVARSGADASATKDPTAAQLLREAADISRVFLIGDSSGAILVHFVAARVGQADGADAWAPLRLAGGIPIHLGFVRATRSRSELETKADSVFFSLDMLDKFNAMALPEGAPRDHPFTCPMGPLAPPLESVPLPPMLVAVGEHDLVRDTNLEYCDALRDAGKQVEVLLSRGMSHAFYLNKFAVDTDPITGERTRELIDTIVNFVSRH